jgi:dihydroneopterin aldolase
MKGDVQMAPPNTLAQDLAEGGLNRLEPFRNAEVQVEKPVVHTAN